MNAEETPAVPAPPNGRALRAPIVVVALLLGGGAIVLARHYKRPDPPKEVPAPGMTVGSDSVTLANDAPMWSVVKVAPAEPAQPHWTDPVPARIVFDEAHTSRLGSPLAGRVTATMVERGQHVKTGDKLFTVSSPNLAELRADLEKANVERGTAKINFDRVKALVDAGSLPAKELVTAQQEVTEAELAVKLANQKLASLKVVGGGDAQFTVVAPRDGVVVEKNVAVGQEVDTSAGSVMAIADLSDVWVVADLFENDVGSLEPSDKAKVIVGGTTEVDGQIDQVSAVVVPDRHTVPVRVRLANLSGTLRPNAYAQIKFFDPTPAKVSLPSSAVMSDGAQTYVYVKDKSGALKKRTVVAGSASGGKMPILEGLEPGEQVVVQGAILLDNQIQLDN
ncbi:MAG: efflux RND transporter periplasmic adaptor subunit [Deltaproteobacteria bacterium]|nr:efflux RND transporter periplasmic adaptor subunit [Deltaproteobacteria bacterium]